MTHKIALLSMDCFSSKEAICKIIAQHHDQINVVVISKPVKSIGFVIKEVMKFYRQAGASFVTYLLLNFVLHPPLSKMGKKPTIKQHCQRYGVKYIEVRNVNSAMILDRLRVMEIDLIVSYYFDQIMKMPLIELPAKGVVNFHPAYLPNCRGLHPTLFSTLYEQAQYGVTAHAVIDATIDTGPILQQQRYQSQAGDILSIERDVMLAGVSLFTQVISHFDQLSHAKTPQGEGSYYSHPKRKDIKLLKHRKINLYSIGQYLRAYFDRTSTQQASSVRI